jgi:anti-sigma regulatory factor (Ser/Thr protein kinase)
VAGDTKPIVLPIEEATQAGEARRAAATLAAGLGFSETDAGRVAIVVTEAAGNLAKHAREGVLVLQSLSHDHVRGIEVLAIDRGPGMSDPGRCLHDGYSTAGSPGTGLGSIRRLAHEFDLHSVPGAGSVVMARLWSAAPRTLSAATMLVGALSVPVLGEFECGDAWAVRQRGNESIFLVVDGLGHGVHAAEAAAALVRSLDESLRQSAPGPVELLERAHAALRGTRGAAAAIAVVDTAAGSVRFAGIGNIAANILTDGASRSMVSHNGIVGHQMRKVQEFAYPWSPDSVLVLASDGLKTQWRLDAYPGLARCHPAVVAGTLWRDFTRGRDDVTVLVARRSALSGTEGMIGP